MSRFWLQPAALVASLVLAACGGMTAQNKGSTTAGQVARVSFQCRLPVGGFALGPAPKNGLRLDSDGQPVQKSAGGFVNFPNATYQAAADSDRSYVASTKTWLPAPPEAVAPDQRSFVEAKAPNGSPFMADTVYLVDVQSNAKRVIFTAPAGEMLDVLAYGAAGVFVVSYSSFRPVQNAAASIVLDRVELINPQSGSHKPVPGSEASPNAFERWSAVTGNAMWGSVTVPPQDIQSPPALKLVRLSLQDGALADWYQSTLSSSSGFPQILGFDANDHPILGISPPYGPGEIYGAPLQLLLLTGPNQTRPIHPIGSTFRSVATSSFRDGHGTWFGGSDGTIWLYTPSGDFLKVATVPPQPSPPTLGYDPGKVGTPFNPLSMRSVAGSCV